MLPSIRARWTGVVTALLLAGGAHAETVALAPMRVHGGAPALRDTLRASIEGGVTAGGHRTLPDDQVAGAIAIAPAVAACETEVCLRKLGELAGAQAVLLASIEVLGSSNYSFHLELADTAGRGPLLTLDDACPICTQREANEALSRAAAVLMKRLPPQPAPASATPPAASTTPARPAVRRVPPRARLYTGLGASALALGLGALGGGAALLALDGRTEGSPFLDSMGEYATRTFAGTVPGAILLGAGGLLVVGGGILLWRASVARR